MKQQSCHHVNTLALAVSELQHRCDKLSLERNSGGSPLSNIFFDVEEALGKKDLHMYVKELDPDMRLASLGRIGFFRTRGCVLVGRVLGQDIFTDGSAHESLKILEKPLRMFQPGWLVPDATEPTKATLSTEPVPLEMIIDHNGSPYFFSADFLAVFDESFVLPPWC